MSPASPFLDEALIAGPAPSNTSPFLQPQAPTRAAPGATGWRFKVVDRAGAPLAGAAWSLHQGLATWRGVLDAGGDSGVLAPTGAAPGTPLDATKPFRLHVPGYACCIVRGAALVADDRAVEYGGAWLDWTRAAEPAFWAEHDAARQSPDTGPLFRFMQHDHVMRRPIRALDASKPAVFEARPLAIRLGPIVRYTDDDETLIWLELETPGLVRVRYGVAADQKNRPKPGAVPASTQVRHACSVRVGGRHFALVSLTGLAADTAYQYTLELAPQPAVGLLPDAEDQFHDAVFPARLPQPALAAQQRALGRLSYNGSHWLVLRTLPRETKALRFVHGSCRKWPNDGDRNGPVRGPDMLDAFGRLWLGSEPWAKWPHYLLHTGDQIYADDIGLKLGGAMLAERRAASVPGPAPRRVGDVAHGAWAGRFGNRCLSASAVLPGPTREELKALQGQRLAHRNAWQIETAIARAESAFRQHDVRATALAGAGGKPTRTPMRHKLRVRNELLWDIPVELADIPRVDLRRGLVQAQDWQIGGPSPRQISVPYPAAGETGGVHAADFAEYAAAHEQAWSTFETRRALAHLPSYMIFDDHEVTDDWNADERWLDTIHTKRDPLGCWPATMTDALAAYWVYQGWGNLAPAAARDDPRVQILDRCRRSGRDALPELRDLIFERALRPTAPGGDVKRKLSWHFSIPSGGTPVVALDLRTDRDVRGSGGLSPERLAWLESELLAARGPAAVIVLPVPFLMPAPMLWAMRHPTFTGVLAGEPSTAAFKRHSDIEHPATNPVGGQLVALLRRLQARATPLRSVVIVSGDIHFSCNLDGQLRGSKRAPRLVQLVSSGLMQVISQNKQDKMKSAYQGALNTISGAEGLDKQLKGLDITVGGLQGPAGGAINFLYPTSFALVELRDVPAGKGRAPVIEQTHYTLDKSGALAAWRFRHMTQPNGGALMSLHDPAPGTPRQPSTYPASKNGLGFVKEAEDEPAAAAPAPAFELTHRADDVADEVVAESEAEAEPAEAPAD